MVCYDLKDIKTFFASIKIYKTGKNYRNNDNSRYVYVESKSSFITIIAPTGKPTKFPTYCDDAFCLVH